MTSFTLTGLLDLLRKVPAYRRLRDALQAREQIIEPLGLLSAARAPVLAALHRDLQVPVLVAAATPDAARELHQLLRTWAPDPGRVLLFPEPDAMPYERVPWDPATIERRLVVLTALAAPSLRARPDPPLVVASARALMQMTMPPEAFAAGVRLLQQGQRTSLDELLRHLYAWGYQPASIVAAPGFFSHRGGIVDVFPPDSPGPVRIEFFGDEIESLRLYDPATQRSQQRLQSVLLTPAREAIHGQSDEAVAQLTHIDLAGLNEEARGQLQRDLEALERGEVFDSIEYYLPHLYDWPATLLDYLPSTALLAIEAWEDMAAAAADLETQAVGLRQSLEELGDLPLDFGIPYVTWDDLGPALRDRTPLCLGYSGPEGWAATEVGGGDDALELSDELGLRQTFVNGPRYGGRLREAIVDCVEMTGGTRAMVVVSRQAKRLTELFREWGVYITPVESITEPPPAGSLTLVQGTLGEGWELKGGSQSSEPDVPASRRTAPRVSIPRPPVPTVLTLLTDGEIFGWRLPQPRRAPPRERPAPESFFGDLRPADYVVHIEHGIGLFQGLVKLNISGVEREYLEIDYAAGDKLYVPAHQVDRVSRYVGLGERPPHINRLGTTNWERVKKQAKRAVEDIAQELLEIYAAREVAQGHAFSPDTSWQAELEASFPYVETEDQLRAINEVKDDMEKPRPMDRLICGDVGYGKTEVALRAAFKAVMDGKQVAMLVPTTILAQQHYRTFRDRLAAFPVEVEMLSRFRSKEQQKAILERLRKGTVDIVIGTHRLLQKDVAFKDVGLVVIDEEQRFGVTHKEKLRKMRTTVDVLTLTATPIPRTLHLSLTGVRDMSTIDTPPEERLPVVTRVCKYDEALIRRAILRELNRGGQVYFVHNRVQTIGIVARRLARIAPEATLAVAHGQMKEGQLSRAMLDFADGKVDVLVSTSIIESGLDIPNVNTLIVDRADLFGLADLYQLRGRVGRSSQRAYAYFMYRHAEALTEDARRRLEAIFEASELGAGFRIAMKDLEIRGAGDILGSRQHGHITAVGFDLYCRLLAQAVREMQDTEKGGEGLDGSQSVGLQHPEGLPAVDLPIEALLPEGYVPQTSLRLSLYRRMGELTSLDQVEEMARELEDRFGPLPGPAENLLYILRIRTLAAMAGVSRISTEDGRIVVRWRNRDVPYGQAIRARFPGSVSVGRRQVFIGMHDGTQNWQRRLTIVLKTAGDH